MDTACDVCRFDSGKQSESIAMSTDINGMHDSNPGSLSTSELLIALGLSLASPLLLILALMWR